MRTTKIAVAVLTAAAGFGLWTTAPAAHAATSATNDAVDVCVDATVDNEGDECCDGQGKATLDPTGAGLICADAEGRELPTA